MNNLELVEQLDVIELKLHVLYTSMLQIAVPEGRNGETKFVDTALCGCGILFDEMIQQLNSVKSKLN